MPLTSAQLATFKTAILADSNLTALVSANDTAAIAAYYNAASPGGEKAWLTNMTLKQVLKAIVWTEFIGRSQGERDCLRMMLMGSTNTAGIDASDGNIRQGFTDIFSGPSGAATRTNLTNAAQRVMNRLEKLFATGPVSGVYTLVVEGTTTHNEVSTALAS